MPLNPKLAVWYDVDKIKGAYFEGSISHSIQPQGEKFSVTLGALAGFNAGQGIPDDPLSDQSFNFADNGFTHLDLSAGVPFTAGPLSISPALHRRDQRRRRHQVHQVRPTTGELTART